MENIPEEDVARVVVMSDEEMKTISSNVDDLCHIDDLNEKSLFQTLKLRYHEKKIYTFISSILISLNPFQEMQIYTPDVLKSYILGTVSLDSPHIYGLSRVAFNRMVLDKVNQSIIISGESGAGKSETTKFILQYLAGASQEVTDSPSRRQMNSTQKQIIEASPILESFGNSKTLRNNNSSRFGKLIKVNFDSSGAIISGAIECYLLEKSRVVQQREGEKGFHVFYQLLAYTNGSERGRTQDELRGEFHDSNIVFDDAFIRSLQLDTQGITDSLPGATDGQSWVSAALRSTHLDPALDFRAVLQSMRTLGFSRESIQSIIQVLAGILHLNTGTTAVPSQY